MTTTATTDAQMGSMARALREGPGLSVRAAAKRAATSPRTLARVERGERWLDPFLRRRLVDAYAGGMARQVEGATR